MTRVGYKFTLAIAVILAILWVFLRPHADSDENVILLSDGTNVKITAKKTGFPIHSRGSDSGTDVGIEIKTGKSSTVFMQSDWPRPGLPASLSLNGGEIWKYSDYIASDVEYTFKINDTQFTRHIHDGGPVIHNQNDNRDISTP